MHDALEQVKQVIGEENVSGLANHLITDVLWDNWFDVEKTVQWAYGASPTVPGLF